VTLDATEVTEIVDRDRRSAVVSLSFAGDGRGGDIMVFAGRSTIDRDAPSADRVEPFVTKYEADMDRIGLTPEHQAADGHA
jgi:hypothetical protein